MLLYYGSSTMSRLANAFMSIAFSIANYTNSGLAIEINETSAEWWFRPKNSDENRVWENHYEDIAFYLGDSAQPVKWTFDLENVKNRKEVNALENAVATKYYKTFMKQESISRMFSISGPKTEQMMKLLYGVIGGIVVIAMLQLAMYGGM